MIVDHDLKLVVLHIPKCAGTALRRAFLEDGADRRIESWFDFSYDPVLKRQVDLAHRPLMDLRHTQLWRWLRTCTSLERLFWRRCSRQAEARRS